MPKKGKLGDAIQYALNYEAQFKAVLTDPRLVLDNNRTESAIRGWVTSHKNWLFSVGFKRAKSAAIIMSLIATAQANDLNPKKYIEYLLKSLPNLETLTDSDALTAYLPWAETVQEKCRKT